MSTAQIKDGEWYIEAPLGTIETDTTKTINILTQDNYVDKDIKINITAAAPTREPATLAAVGTISVDAEGTNTISIGDKSGNSYPISATTTIKGKAVASTTASGYATKGTTSAEGDITPKTLTMTAEIPAVGLAASGSGSVSISANGTGSASITSGTVEKENGKYYVEGSGSISGSISGSGTGTGTASVSVTSSGYGKAGAETASKDFNISGTASGSIGGTATAKIQLNSSTLDNKATSGKTYTENTSIIIPSEGALYINAGYIEDTYITLDQMLDGKPDTAGIADSDIRSGKIAYDVKGKKLTGAMGNATVVGGDISHTLGTPTYNSTSGKFDQSCSITTAAPSVSSAGYISSTEGTKTASTQVNENHALNKIGGSVGLSGSTTLQPSIARQTFSISGVTDASSGNATTTAPSSGVYVKVKSAANTGTLTATPSISTAGYGTSANHGISGNSATVGASASEDTYIPIKTGSASVTGKSIGGSASGPTYNSGTGNFDITFSASGTVGGSATAGWISSVSGATVTAGATKSIKGFDGTFTIS